MTSYGKCSFLVESMWGREMLLNEGNFTFYKNAFFFYKHAILKTLADDSLMTGIT